MKGVFRTDRIVGAGEGGKSCANEISSSGQVFRMAVNALPQNLMVIKKPREATREH